MLSTASRSRALSHCCRLLHRAFQPHRTSPKYRQQSFSGLACATAMDGEQVKLWIDTDAGVDDAQGIILAAADPRCQIQGIGCVHGNTDLHQVARNVFRVLTLCGRPQIPVFLGSAEPLIAEPVPSNYWFGRDGLGDAPQARPTHRDIEMMAPHPGHAAVRLIECAREHEGQLTVVALGPLTNIALACKLDPALPSRLRRLVVMGSSEQIGNVTPVAEFNFHRDPEAAQVVMAQFANAVSSGRPCSLVVVSWECTEKHPLPWHAVDMWLSKPTLKARFLAAISESSISAVRNTPSGARGWECADPLAVAVALRPHLILGTKQVYCRVETQSSDLTRGMAVWDWNKVLKKAPNVSLVTTLAMEELLATIDMSID